MKSVKFISAQNLQYMTTQVAVGDCSIRYVLLENPEDNVKQCLCFVITLHT